MSARKRGMKDLKKEVHALSSAGEEKARRNSNFAASLKRANAAAMSTKNKAIAAAIKARKLADRAKQSADSASGVTNTKQTATRIAQSTAAAIRKAEQSKAWDTALPLSGKFRKGKKK